MAVVGGDAALRRRGVRLTIAGSGGAFDEVVVFDLDDTLYLERDYVESGLRAVGAWAAVQLRVPGLGDHMVARFRAGDRGRLFDDAIAAAGLSPTPCLIARMLQVYRQHRPRIRLAEDAARWLARRAQRTAVAIITDGYLDAQKRKIRALRLHCRGVALAVCTDRWGRTDWKPSLRAFEHVQRHFGSTVRRLCYVADNPDKDFHAPHALGWRTVQIARSGRIHDEPAPHAQYGQVTISSLDELASTLDPD